MLLKIRMLNIICASVIILETMASSSLLMKSSEPQVS